MIVYDKRFILRYDDFKIIAAINIFMPTYISLLIICMIVVKVVRILQLGILNIFDLKVS